MDDKLKADISKIVDEAVSSRLLNQQATLTFNLENIDAEDKLKKMLMEERNPIFLQKKLKKWKLSYLHSKPNTPSSPK